MSAFIVNKKHIDYILSASLMNKYVVDYHSLDKTGQILINENFKSVNYRYNESHQPYQYKFQQISNIDVIQALKAIHCLEYQSCEHKNWNRSKAKKILNTIKENLIYSLPGYNECLWVIQ